MSSDTNRRSFLGAVGLLATGSAAALRQSSVVQAESDAASSVGTDAATNADVAGNLTRPLDIDGWTQYNANAANTANPAVDAPRAAFETKWRTPVGEVSEQSAVVGDTLYVPARDGPSGSETGAVHAVDADDGSVSWTTPAADPRAPAATTDAVYVSDSHGLHALDPSDGSERWTFARGDGAESDGETLWSERGAPASAPALTDAAVFVALPDALYALDRTDGSVLWERRIDDPDSDGVSTRGVPAVGEETVYFAAGSRADQTVHAVDAATGEERWTTSGFGTSVAVGDAVVVRTKIRGGDAIRALDERTGEERWRFITGHTGMVAVDDDTVYCVVGFSTYSLVALDVETGETRWRQHESRGPYPFFVDVGVVVAGDTLYLGSNEGLLTLDTEAGAFLDVHEFADDNEFWPPVVADGAVYVSDERSFGGDAELYALTQGEGGEPDEDC
ncbi:outer membrane protein assembly factor BamB family protein [Halogranum rubrum]|uniref:Pyrrolo-quinoline quinone repeat domain-containing protein n=1 Tax=Halogranum salarium B-1 TaxID=1210908 RepID=J3A603_9EURY|nr:PQQ-binding-like beta-propeller repeat protein [Halogranum salarium]EJN60913.1 hypothetical protein HSB1_15160 [Halogranum salarium B-1]